MEYENHNTNYHSSSEEESSTGSIFGWDLGMFGSSITAFIFTLCMVIFCCCIALCCRMCQYIFKSNQRVNKPLSFENPNVYNRMSPPYNQFNNEYRRDHRRPNVIVLSYKPRDVAIISV